MTAFQLIGRIKRKTVLFSFLCFVPCFIAKWDFFFRLFFILFVPEFVGFPDVLLSFYLHPVIFNWIWIWKSILFPLLMKRNRKSDKFVIIFRYFVIFYFLIAQAQTHWSVSRWKFIHFKQLPMQMFALALDTQLVCKNLLRLLLIYV